MKTFGQFSPPATPLAVAISLLLFSGNLRAYGPGGTGNNGSISGAGTSGGVSTGVAAAGGSRGGSVSTSGGVRTASGPTTTGARPGVSFSNNAPRPSIGASTRGPVGRFDAPVGYSAGVRTAPSNADGSRPTFRAPSRAANAWSGTAIASTGNANLRNDSSRRTFPTNGFTENRAAGQHLDPSANGANLTANRATGNGSRNHRNRFPYRYFNDPYACGPAYAPYIGYYGGYEGAYPYYADGAYADGGNGFDNVTPTVTPQYVDQGKDANDDEQNPAPQAERQNPTASTGAQPTVPNNGPDSLVEAVQQELIRRGYFAGKVDAMYGADTKEALRKFQQDHHLAESGLINEATLHALQLD